jgi:4-hydroxy-3-methylbut-2-enyl diphosphate reductase
MVVEIDNRSGFCFGVVKAIKRAETELEATQSLFCLGEIVHNDQEVERLKGRGLKTIEHNDLAKYKGKTVLFRAHGEPPSTYQKAKELGINVVDASCPVVLRLQARVREGWERMKAAGGQVVIFGKHGHAEVVGLIGQTLDEAIIVSCINDIDKIDLSKPIELFAQTTQSPDDYIQIAEEIQVRMDLVKAGHSVNFRKHNSICGQVANRKRELAEFVPRFDVIIFVSGKKSSNGKMLFEVCKSLNGKTYFVSKSQEIKKEWFLSSDRVGICGATSTPKWLMEEAASHIYNFFN